jgi:hypothetical protein
MIKNTLALNLIADVMAWDNVRATDEYDWLRLMSVVKYDSYADFAAGSGFIEALVDWMRQFDKEDRETAYRLVKTRLVFISSAEMQRLIEAFLPEFVTPYLRSSVASDHDIQPYEVWADKEPSDAFADRLRKCLFVGLSDGSRIDILRRANAGELSQEQVVPMMNVDREKWISLGQDLKDECGDDAKFEDVYLVDDFTASGTTFIRLKDGQPKGKLPKFEKMVSDARKVLGTAFPIAKNYRLHIHHYVSTVQARQALLDRIEEVIPMLPAKSFQDEIAVHESLLLPDTLPLGTVCEGTPVGGHVEAGTNGLRATYPEDRDYIDLCEKYYDPSEFKRLEVHCREAGLTTLCYGYGYCALPLILEHNTPNNTVPLLWSETGEPTSPRTRSLFQRRDRHG